MSYRKAISTAVRPGRPRDEGRDGPILDAAWALVAEVGYDRTTMDAVAARARASKATIYRRWPGKAELVVAAIEHRLGHKEPMTFTGDLRADLLRLLTDVRDHMEGPDGDLVLGLSVAARRDAALAASMRAQFEEKLCPTTADLVAAAIERGELPAGADPTVLDDLLPAQLLFRQIQGRPIGDDELAHIADHILLPLLRAQRGTPE